MALSQSPDSVKVPMISMTFCVNTAGIAETAEENMVSRQIMGNSTG